MAAFGGYVYMLYNRERSKLYIGVTSNLLGRIHTHLHGGVKGYATQNKCRELVFYEFHPLIAEAIAREKQLKRWGRAKKDSLVGLVNPEWLNLIEDLGDSERLPVIAELPVDLDSTGLICC